MLKSWKAKNYWGSKKFTGSYKKKVCNPSSGSKAVMWKQCLLASASTSPSASWKKLKTASASGSASASMLPKDFWNIIDEMKLYGFKNFNRIWQGDFQNGPSNSTQKIFYFKNLKNVKKELLWLPLPSKNTQVSASGSSTHLKFNPNHFTFLKFENLSSGSKVRLQFCCYIAANVEGPDPDPDPLDLGFLAGSRSGSGSTNFWIQKRILKADIFSGFLAKFQGI